MFEGPQPECVFNKELPFRTPRERKVRGIDNLSTVYWMLFTFGLATVVAAQPGSQTVSISQAARAGDDQLVAEMLKAGVKADKRGTREDRALVWAARTGNVAIAKMLLDAGATPKWIVAEKDTVSPETVDDDAWPLRIAVRKGFLEFTRLLLEHDAPVNQRDHESRSVMHDISLTDGSLNLSQFGQRFRTLTPAHSAIVPLLAAKGLKLGHRDKEGATILRGVFDGPYDREFVAALVRAGAPLEGIAELIRDGDIELLNLYLEKGLNPNGEGMLDIAIEASSKDERPLLRLIAAGASLPVSTMQADFLLKVISRGATETTAFLLRSGFSGRANDKSYTMPLSEALKVGSPQIVRLLLDSGVPATEAHGSSKLTALHSVILNDLESGRRPVIRIPQIQAIAALIDGGFDLEAKDGAGRTVVDCAAENPLTMERLRLAIAAAGGRQTELHRIIRSDDLKALANALSQGKNVDALDSLGRTPLNLALSMRRYEAAEKLLRAKAKISFSSAHSFTLPDQQYLTSEHIPDEGWLARLVESFHARIFATRLLRLQSSSSLTSAKRIIAEFDRNNATHLEVVWNTTCAPCRAGYAERLPIIKGKVDSPTSSKFYNNQLAVAWLTYDYPHGVGQPKDYREVITTTTEGKIVIPACTFEALADSACYPGVTIKNTSPVSSETVEWNNETFPITSSTVTVTQNSHPTPVGLGSTEIFDRSAGPLTITIGPVKAKAYAMSAEVSFIRHPSLLFGDDGLRIRHADGGIAFVSTNFRPETRAVLYAQLARLHEEFAALGLAQTVRRKTILTALSVISAWAVREKYPEAIETELRSLADTLAVLDERVTQLLTLVVEGNVTTPAHIEDMVHQVEQLLPSVAAPERADLARLRQRLIDLQRSSASITLASDALRAGLETDVERNVRRYQSLILELAQYRPSTAGIIPASTRHEIAKRLRPRQSIIEDIVLDGRGADLRRDFGLPLPTTIH